MHSYLSRICNVCMYVCMYVYVCVCSRNEDNPSASTLISDEVLQMMSGRSSRQSCRDEREMVRVRTCMRVCVCVYVCMYVCVCMCA